MFFPKHPKILYCCLNQPLITSEGPTGILQSIPAQASKKQVRPKKSNFLNFWQHNKVASVKTPKLPFIGSQSRFSIIVTCHGKTLIM